MTNSYLKYEDRRNLEALYKSGESLTDIAAKLGVHLATIYRELTRGYTGKLDKNGRGDYNADTAQKAFLESLKQRGRRKSAK